MNTEKTGSNRPAPSWTRRSWLGAALVVGGGLGLGRGLRGAEDATDEAAMVQEQARKAGLGPFRSSVSAHYLGIGDAPDDHRNMALKLCETLATAYRKYFQDKKFAVAFPQRRLTVVALKDKASYAAFIGEDPGEAVGGHYDLDTNRLVIFDFNPDGEGGNLDWINTFTLIHEATHQLTFNTGLLDRHGDVPVAISEGLAMFAELWRPDGRSVLGATNRVRLKVLIDQARTNQPEIWIPIDKLLTGDGLFEDEATVQLAYAESWVLVRHLLKTTAMLPKFRAYLDAIRPRRAASERLADAKAHLGDLDRLNLELRKDASRLIREIRRN